MKIYKGATYNLPVQIKINKETLPLNDVKKVEFAFGDNLIKTHPSNDVERNGDKLIVKLSAQDTNSLEQDIVQKLQARITFNDNSIKFTKLKSFVAVETRFSEGVQINVLRQM
jgi:hypothetical protein